MWHRTNMQKRQQMPEAQPVDALDQPDPYRGGTPGDQKTAVDKIPVPQFPQIKPLAERRLEGPFQARIVLITGDRLVILRCVVEQLVEKYSTWGAYS